LRQFKEQLELPLSVTPKLEPSPQEELSPLRDLVESPKRSKVKALIKKEEGLEEWTPEMRNRRKLKEEDRKRERSKPSNRPPQAPQSP